MKSLTLTRMNFRSPLMWILWITLGLGQLLVTSLFLSKGGEVVAVFLGWTILTAATVGLMYLLGGSKITMDEKGIRNKKQNYAWWQIQSFLVYYIGQDGQIKMLTDDYHKQSLPFFRIKYICLSDKENFNPLTFMPGKNSIIFQYRDKAYDFIGQQMYPVQSPKK